MRWLFWGRFRRARMNALVEQVRAHALGPDELRTFRLEGDDLVQLPPSAPAMRGTGAGRVWARQGKDGLQVVLQTRDLGHAGEYGFAFSESPLEPAPYGDGGLALDLPSHLHLVHTRARIDKHWWRVLYNLG